MTGSKSLNYINNWIFISGYFVMGIRLKNILSFIVVFVGFASFYYLVPYYHNMFSQTIEIHFLNYFSVAWDYFTLYWLGVSIYLIGYVIYYASIGDNLPNKTTILFDLMEKCIRLDLRFTRTQTQAFFNIAIKAFYLPLMFFWFWTNLKFLINTGSNVVEYLNSGYVAFYDFYRRHLHWLLFNAILTLDVVVFLIGYSLELEVLGNKIKSAESTWLGRFSALACYPILNTYVGKILNWYSSDFPDFVKQFGESIIYYKISTVFGILFVVLMGIYAWASVSLMFKASNLTNRGIVVKGPYSIVRHPAYFCKNTARFVGALPVISLMVHSGEYSQIGLVLLSVFGRMFIYHMRAWTEERHLSADKDYLEYKKKVKYMYIPGVI